MAKDAKGHGSNGGWSRVGTEGVKAKYIQHGGNKAAIVRTEPSNDGNHIWQFGKEYGFAGSVDSAKGEVENRAAAAALSSGGPKSDTVPVHDSMVQDTYPGAGPAPSHWSATDQASYNAKNGWSRSNPNYHAGAVQNAINSSNRSGRRIGGREAKMIHRLLSGR